MRFDPEQFVADCRAALGAERPAQAVRETVARAISGRHSVLEALGCPTRAGLHRIYCAEDLTILNVVWAPGMTIMPHDHRMWAVIGVYSGREDNILWRRMRSDAGGRIEADRAKSLQETDTLLLAPEAIHSVTNPISRFSCAIHVYGGDFFGAARSEWDPESLLEQPFDIEHAMRRFEEHS
jgi:predicted metal-dependent enzyme (double-stranded beta helix superfamily)